MLGDAKIVVYAFVADIMSFDFCRGIQAGLEFTGIIHDPKKVLEVLDSAKAGREVMEEGMRPMTSNRSQAHVNGGSRG